MALQTLDIAECLKAMGRFATSPQGHTAYARLKEQHSIFRDQYFEWVGPGWRYKKGGYKYWRTAQSQFWHSLLSSDDCFKPLLDSTIKASGVTKYFHIVYHKTPMDLLQRAKLLFDDIVTSAF